VLLPFPTISLSVADCRRWTLKADDTRAIQNAIDHDRGSVDQKRPAAVYFPPGTYLVSDTIVTYYHTHLMGSLSGAADCRSQLVLADRAGGFGDAAAAKPMVVTDNGFNRSTSSPWWKDTVDKNMLFYAQIHHLDFHTGNDNRGAVAILWAVAQQTSLRDIAVVAGDSLAGIDVGFSDNFNYSFPKGGRQSCGGGGTVNQVHVTGGQYGVRISASQWYLDQVHTTGQSKAGLLIDRAWAVVLLDVQVTHAPVGIVAIAKESNILVRAIAGMVKAISKTANLATAKIAVISAVLPTRIVVPARVLIQGPFRGETASVPRLL
jgi:hypothetical protein